MMLAWTQTKIQSPPPPLGARQGERGGGINGLKNRSGKCEGRGGVDGVKNRNGQWEGLGGGELDECIMHRVHTSLINMHLHPVGLTPPNQWLQFISTECLYNVCLITKPIYLSTNDHNWFTNWIYVEAYGANPVVPRELVHVAKCCLKFVSIT